MRVRGCEGACALSRHCFIGVLPRPKARMSLWVIGAGFFVACFFFGASGPLILELGSEICFPVSEGTAAAYINMVFMSTNVAGMEAGNALSGETANVGLCVVLLVCAVALLPVSGRSRRYDMDVAQAAKRVSGAAAVGDI